MLPEARVRRGRGPGLARFGGWNARRRALRNLKFLLAVALITACGSCRGSEQAGEEAFVAERSVTLWTSLAQVKEPVTSVRYGERVEIVARQNDQAKVRTSTGVLGWTEQRNLMESALWHRARDLARSALSMPVQAQATSDKLTNVHIDPGRTSPRIYQLRSGTRLEILGRATADFTRGGAEETGTAPAGAAVSSPPATGETRHEDWALVRAHDDPAGDLAGWVLRRFVKFEIPPELLDYSTQYRFVAWFELGRVPTGEPESPPKAKGQRAPREAPGPPESAQNESAPAPAEKPQFLVAGIQGPEGQPCDFTLIRVYTWGAQRQRYETAYVESNLCGSLPIRIQSAEAAGANAAFMFTNRGRAGEEHREYTMHQTSVHRTDNRRPLRGRH